MVPSRVTCFVESMESRTLMSIALGQGVPQFDTDLPLAEPPPPLVTLEQGVLTINGTDGNDDITVGIVSRRLDRVAWRGRWQFLQRARPRYYEVAVKLNGVNAVPLLARDLERIPVGKVRSIVVHAGAGDDTVVIGGDYKTNVSAVLLPRSQPATVDATVYGGDGADMIVGGRGNDTLYGGGGDDHMFGLGGTDVVDGGDGNDRLGDACEDSSASTMLGGPGDDVLVGHHDGRGLLSPRPAPGPHSLFGGPGNDEFQAPAGEVRDVEPGESVTPAVCYLVYVR